MVGDHSLFAEGAVRAGLVPIFGDAAHADFGVVPRGAAVFEEDRPALFRRRLRHNGGGARHCEGDHTEHLGSTVWGVVLASAGRPPRPAARHPLPPRGASSKEARILPLLLSTAGATIAKPSLCTTYKIRLDLYKTNSEWQSD